MRVNSKVTIAKTLGEKQLSEISFWVIKQAYDTEIKNFDTVRWEIIKYLAIVRPVGARTTNTLESFEDFSEGEWDRIYNIVLNACTERQKTKASLKIEVSITASIRTELKEIKKRVIDVALDPEPE